MNNALYLRRRSKLVLPAPVTDGDRVAPAALAALLKNIEALGYTFSEPLLAASRALTLEQAVALYEEIVPALQALRGAHQEFRPFYPNFPEQVMALDEAELYLNAIVHYWSYGRLYPVTERKARLPLLDTVELTVIESGTGTEFEAIVTQLAAANTVLSEQDRADLAWFVAHYREGIARLLPESVPQKENVAALAGLLLQHLPAAPAQALVARYLATATDLLRLAVALSGGDLSLASSTKFRSFTRAERALLLGLLDALPNPVEDMLRWKGRWIRLGEKLHPREYEARYPKAAAAFAALRNDMPIPTFRSAVEKALAQRDIATALSALRTRPGELARRLDHVLRCDPASTENVLAAFAEVAERVATPVLLQVQHHFVQRNTDPSALRVFLPKGNVAKAQGVPNTLPALADALCQRVAAVCEIALLARFAALPPLGKVYVDPALADYNVPFALRSASRSLRTLVRGSRLPLPDAKTIRLFLWWRNGTERTDIDLSAVLFDESFGYIDVLSYYNLKGYGCAHSGDIVDAPDGASEFIDLAVEKLQAKKVRYVVMNVHSYTVQPFVALPECFAGWMARRHPQSGEVFEPSTVQDRLDLTADTQIAIPLVIDLAERKVIWCDLALRRHPNWHNNVAANRSGINLMLQSVVQLRKPNLHTLLTLHARARGVLVERPDDAEVIFSVANGTPFQLEALAADYM